jgi:2-polyprenyl-3-methyl-5-hydroxy-6-metoxy-1,4-benzoquinol methylase
MDHSAQRLRWEQEEVERSRSEASNTKNLKPRVSEITRYLQPPADTCYPLEYAFHLLGDVRGKDVLDLGCGSGENTLLLAHRRAKVIALDISPDLIHVAKRRMSINGVVNDVEFLTASAHDLPLPNESVDVVFGIAILHHLDMATVSAQVMRVLRPGGRAIFQEPMRDSRMLRVVRKLIPYKQKDVSSYEYPLSNKDIAILVQPFESYRAKNFQLPFMRVVRIFRWYRWLPQLYKADRRLLDRYPVLGHYATVRVLELTKAREERPSETARTA